MDTRSKLVSIYYQNGRHFFMFTNPELRKEELVAGLVANPLHPVSQPLFGEDFYVAIKDLQTHSLNVGYVNTWQW